MNAEKLLVTVLRVVAVAAWLAVVPVFMPHAWMNACHSWLGLGPLPETPIIVYLTRSLSALYVFHGGLLWLVSRDVRRYATIITYLAVATLLFGTVTLWIDIRAQLPWFWIAYEGPFAIALGACILGLQRSLMTKESSEV